ncbi:MAG: hypothetical protein WD512_18230 [Candidatus Paceibacterota bacterium]
MPSDLEKIAAFLNDHEDMRRMMEKTHEEMVKALTPPDLQNEGWVYKDIPWTTIDNFNLLVTIIGEDNLVLIASSVKQSNDGDIIRGQFWISPQGIENCAEYREQNDV